MTVPDVPLSAENREVAKKIWDVFATAKAQSEKVIGYKLLMDAPTEVQRAVLAAYTQIWREGRNPVFAKNPFDN